MKTDRWKNRQPPEKFWWKPDHIPDEIIDACRDERDQMAHASFYAYLMAKRAFQHQDKKQAIQDTADHIVGYGYYLALRDYKPDKGAKFKTFLRHVLFRRVYRWTGGFKKNCQKSCHMDLQR